VRGLVEQVSFSPKGHVFLNFDGWYPRQVFTGFVRAQDVERLGGQDFLRSLADNPLISGKIEHCNGRPEIVITSRAQIESL
jgi:hypothetical protein